jgi:hypothetical protein
MKKPIEQIAQALYNKLTRFEDITLGDKKADDTDSVDDSRFFNFTYPDTDSEDKPVITIHLSDSGDVAKRALKIHFLTDVLDLMNPEQKKKWKDFLEELRHFAKSNWLNFDVRNLTKSNLTQREIDQLTKNDSVDTDQVKVTESKLFGTSKLSYENVGPVKLLVRHSQNINPEIQGSRTRNIENIFVETEIGERFLMPFTKLSPSRAMARHIAEGGRIGDEIANFIEESAKEMSSMGVFVRSMRRRTFEDAETISMVEAAIERYNEVKSNLNRISGQKGYVEFKESFKPVESDVYDFDLEQLKDRFVKKLFDERLAEALPHVYKAFKTKQKSMENSYVAEFDQWADDVVEGSWALPETDSEVEELRKLMSKPLTAGLDGADAIPALYDLIGDDELFDNISQLSSTQGSESDVRPLLIDWLGNNGYEDLAAEFQMAFDQPQSSPPPSSEINTDQPPMEESISSLRRLAGLAKN